MFRNVHSDSTRRSQWAIAILALLSLMALIVTIWILVDFSDEQRIVSELTRHLPASDLPEANQLAGELRLQWQLSVLLILNVVALCVATALVVKAYISKERSLRDVKVLATDVLASIDQGILTTDGDGLILNINRRGREIIGQEDEITGVEIDNLPSEHLPLSAVFQQISERQEVIQDRDYTVGDDGRRRYLRAGGSLLKDRTGQQRGTVIHLRDMTEIHLMEERMRRMERYMGLGSLAAGLQHEIKNPLSALSLHVQLLKEAIQEAGQLRTLQEHLDVLNDETKRVTCVLESFRDFASVSEINREDVDLRLLVEKLVRLIKPQSQQKKIDVNLSFPKDDLPLLPIDSMRIEQVLLNILLNAIEAMPAGGTLTIGLKESPDRIQLAIRDTGPGIPEDLQEKIFDPYFTTRSQGTGMGLALSEKIVRQHGGTIDFQTSPSGTIFTVSLPRSENSCLQMTLPY